MLFSSMYKWGSLRLSNLINIFFNLMFFTMFIIYTFITNKNKHKNRLNIFFRLPLPPSRAQI